MALVIPLLAAMKGAMRTIAVNEALPEWKAKLQEWSWVWPGACAFCSVSIFVEFYHVAVDQEHPLARHPLRIGLAEHDAHPQTLAGAVSAPARTPAECGPNNRPSRTPPELSATIPRAEPFSAPTSGNNSAA